MNEKGNATLLSMLLVGAITLFCFYTLLFARAQYVSNLSRARAYLCMKHQLVALNNYTEHMSTLNNLISITFKFSLNPKIKVLHQLLQVTQQLYHFSFLHKFIKKGRCHFTQRLPFLYNFPYQNIGLVVLKRHIDGSVKAKKDKKWTVSITNYIGAKHEKPSFILSASLKFENESLKLVETQEEAIQAWALSRLFSSSELLQRWLPQPFKSILNSAKDKLL